MQDGEAVIGFGWLYKGKSVRLPGKAPPHEGLSFWGVISVVGSTIFKRMPVL